MTQLLKRPLQLLYSLAILAGLGVGVHEASSAALQDFGPLCQYSAGGCYNLECRTFCEPKIGICEEDGGSGCLCNCNGGGEVQIPAVTANR